MYVLIKLERLFEVKNIIDYADPQKLFIEQLNENLLETYVGKDVGKDLE